VQQAQWLLQPEAQLERQLEAQLEAQWATHRKAACMKSQQAVQWLPVAHPESGRQPGVLA